MMNSVNLGINKTERTKNQIIHLLEKLTSGYQSTKLEGHKIIVNFPADDGEFSILEEIELLTVNIRGYASQILVRGEIENSQQAIENLKEMPVFDIPVIADFYFGSHGEYPEMKVYLQMLDYLRLLMLEYLTFDVVRV